MKTLKKARNILKNLCPIYHPIVPFPVSAAPPQISLPPLQNFSLHQLLLYSLFLSLSHFSVFMIYWRAPCSSNRNPLGFLSDFSSLFATPISTIKA